MARYLLTCLFVLFGIFRQGNAASCPISIGGLNVTGNFSTPSGDSRDKEMIIIPALILPCSARIYGWTIMANKSGHVKFAILRKLRRSNLTYTYLTVSKISFHAFRGLNIFRDPKTNGIAGDTIAFVAPEYLVNKRNGNSSFIKSINYAWKTGQIGELETFNESRAQYDLQVILQDFANQDISSKITYYNTMGVTLLTFKNVTFPPLIQDAYFDNNQLKNLESVEYSTCSGEGNICPELPKLRKSLAVEIRTNHGNLFQSDFRISLKGDYRPVEEGEWTPGNDTMKLRVLFPVTWSEWSKWGDCRPTFFKYFQSRTRSCSYRESCTGPSKQERKCNCSAGVEGGTVNCPVGSIMVKLNDRRSQQYQINWKVQRPKGKRIEFEITVKDFYKHHVRCRDDGDRIELRDDSGSWIGVICSNVSKFVSCTNGVEVVFRANERKNRILLPEFHLRYETVPSSKKLEKPSYCKPCGRTLTASTGNIRSRQSAANKYLPNENCVWKIKRNVNEGINITVTKLFLVADDYLDFINGVTNETFLSLSQDRKDFEFSLNIHEVLIKFVSKSGVEQMYGFILNYSAFQLYQINSTLNSTTTTTSPMTTTTTTTSVNQLCSARLWLEWSEWSSCSSSLVGALKGIRLRRRTCQDFQVTFNQTNCSRAPSAGQKQRWNREAKAYGEDMEDSSPSTKKCKDLLNSTRDLLELCNVSSECNDLVGETEETSCVFATKCTVAVSRSWQPWSSCGSNNIQSRTKSCSQVRFAAKGSFKCSVTRFPRFWCPRPRSVQIFPSQDYFPDKPADTPEICDSQCADNANKTCKAFLYPKGNCGRVETRSCGSVCNVSNCEWANWGECSHDCGAATRTRFASCKADAVCDDVMKETEACLNVPCAVDGEWTAWSRWSNCSKPCFGGLQKRTRSCTNPPPSHGGLNCAGINEEIIGCNFIRCPVNAQYGPWSPWSYCDQPCGGGKILRFRQCDSPSADFGGLDCVGASTEVKGCNNHACAPAKFDVFLKFTNETFSLEMMLRNSTAFINFSHKVKSNLLQLYKGRNHSIMDVVINELSNGSVACNFSIIFNQSATDELVILQHATEDVGVMHEMPVKLFSISSPDVPAAPTSVTAISDASATITVKWSGFSTSHNITGFVIFYREFGSNSWQKSPAGRNDTKLDLLMLEEFTLYTIRVFAFARNGMGAGSSYVDCITKEGVPNTPPRSPKCSSMSSTQLFVQWNHINTSNWNGQFHGYMIRHREFTSTGEWFNTTNRKTDCFFTIEHLKPFTRYEVEIAGVTGAGVGKFSWLQCMTSEGAPSSSPENVVAELVSRNGKITVDWDPLPEQNLNGILQGYIVYYTITRVGSEDVPEDVQTVTAPKYSGRVVITGFQPYTQVRIEVAAFTIAGEGPTSTSVYVETCQCPENIYVGWFSYEPYIYGDSSNPVGILPQLVINTVSQICKVCNGKIEHDYGEVNVFFNRTKNGKLGKYRDQKELKQKMDTNAHFFLPIHGREEVEVFQKDFRFILVAHNPGSALLLKKVSPESITDSITNLVLQIWPVVLVVMLMGSILGTFLWFADRQVNPNELNFGSYIKGTLSGVWWSFVTMTTVGYGDITPRSIIGKVIAMFWMLIGPILNSLIIGSLTSAITAVMTSRSTMVYGMTVAAVYQSSEYNLAIRRNARVSQTVLYHNDTDVLRALETGDVNGAILDSLAVASMMNSPKLDDMEIEIGRFIKEPNGFGLVLSPEIMSLKPEIQTYINSKSKEIQELIEEYSEALVETDYSEDDVSANLLGTITSYGQTFKECVVGLSAAIVVFTIVCLSVRSIYRCRRKKKVAVMPLAGVERLKNLEKEICETTDEVISKAETKFKEITQKHEQELEKWFAKQNYNFGLLGIPQFGTMDNQTIKRKITLNDIMLSDLKTYPKKDSRGFYRKRQSFSVKEGLVKSFPASQLLATED